MLITKRYIGQAAIWFGHKENFILPFRCWKRIDRKWFCVSLSEMWDGWLGLSIKGRGTQRALLTTYIVYLCMCLIIYQAKSKITALMCWYKPAAYSSTEKKKTSYHIPYLLRKNRLMILISKGFIHNQQNLFSSKH